MSLSSSSDSDWEIIRVGLQVLANVVLAGEEYQHVVWHHFFPKRFLALARVRSQGTCDGNTKLVAEACGNEGLDIVAEILQTASKVGFEEHWMKSLLSRIWLDGTCLILPSIFSKLRLAGAFEDDVDTELGNDLFSSKQAYGLSIVSEILNARIGEFTVPSNFAMFVLEYSKDVLWLLVPFLEANLVS